MRERSLATLIGAGMPDKLVRIQAIFHSIYLLALDLQTAYPQIFAPVVPGLTRSGVA